jgi:hypothetical protein
MTTTTLDISKLHLSLDEVLALVRKGAAVLFTEGSVPLARLASLICTAAAWRRRTTSMLRCLTTFGWVSHEISQANAEQAALLSCDSVFQKYQVNIIW